MAPLNVPLRGSVFPRWICSATASSKLGVARAMWWTPSPFSARKRAMPPSQPKLFRLESLGDGGWLKTLRLEDYAPRRLRPESLQQALFPYHEAWG